MPEKIKFADWMKRSFRQGSGPVPEAPDRCWVTIIPLPHEIPATISPAAVDRLIAYLYSISRVSHDPVNEQK